MKKTFKIPSEVNVLGYRVRVKKIRDWKGHRDCPESLVGRYYPDTKTIYICTQFESSIQVVFFLHEVNHCIMDIVGIDQNVSRDLQEVIAQSFASFYERFLR